MILPCNIRTPLNLDRLAALLVSYRIALAHVTALAETHDFLTNKVVVF